MCLHTILIQHVTVAQQGISGILLTTYFLLVLFHETEYLFKLNYCLSTWHKNENLKGHLFKKNNKKDNIKLVTTPTFAELFRLQ